MAAVLEQRQRPARVPVRRGAREVDRDVVVVAGVGDVDTTGRLVESGLEPAGRA